MAFQFKRDRAQNLQLILAGDIDLEVTPDIKAQLISQLDDANGLSIDGRNISYLDSSGVSILVISMQSCKQKQLSFKIEAMSEEAFRVLQLAKLDKILPIDSVSGPAQLVDVDAFSGVSGQDGALANEISSDGAETAAAAEPMDDMMGGSDDDLIAALSKGALDSPAEEAPSPTPEPAEAEEEIDLVMTPDPAPQPTPAPAAPTPAPAAPTPATPSAQPSEPDTSGGGGDSGGFKPGTFS